MRKYTKELTIGEEVVSTVYLLKEIVSLGGKEVKIILADRSGEIDAVIPRAILSVGNGTADVRTLLQKPVQVDGVVLANGRQPVLYCKTVIEAALYNAVEIYSGISPAVRDGCISKIKEMCGRIIDKQYKALLEDCLNDDALYRLAQLPATHSGPGSYIGGALVATCSVARIVWHAMAEYVRCGNGFTTASPDWSLLMTAALLHRWGMIEYCDAADPYRKSVVGVAATYRLCLINSLTSKALALGISKEKAALLCNVIDTALQRHSSKTGVVKEAYALKSAVEFYSFNELYDSAAAEVSGTDGYVYDRKQGFMLTAAAKESVLADTSLIGMEDIV